MRSDFAIFILTHERAKTIFTNNMLKTANYTGKIYYILDDEDTQIEEYEKLYGKDKIIIFNKQKAYDCADTMDNFNKHRAIIYARNKTWEIAKTLNLKYFLMLDDDYVSIDYRWAEKGKLKNKKVRNIDDTINCMIEFLEKSKADTVAYCQNGDFIGGVKGKNHGKGLLRKAMNAFFCKVDTPIEFKGTLNEDVVTYTTLSSRGHLFLSYTHIAIQPKNTQSVEGGMTEEYLESGTYVKSFYAVMSMPSSVKVSVMHSQHSRIHHSVSWENTAPKIISERYKRQE